MRTRASLDNFIAMTLRIIAKDGFEGYLPTLVLPARRHIAVLEGIPDGVDVETAALNWAMQKAGIEDFQLAYKIGARHFKVVQRIDGEIEKCVVSAETN